MKATFDGWWASVGVVGLGAACLTAALWFITISPGCSNQGSILESQVAAPVVLTAPYHLRSLGYHKYTVSNTAKDLTDGGGYTIPADTQYIVIAVETAPIRWLDEGTTAEAAVGMPIAAGGYYMLPIQNKTLFSMIRSTGNDATVYILFRGI